MTFNLSFIYLYIIDPLQHFCLYNNMPGIVNVFSCRQCVSSIIFMNKVTGHVLKLALVATDS